MITLDDCRAVNSNRGLEPHVLLELTRLDADAIARGDRFSEIRRGAMAARARCLELRQEHGLGLFDRLRVP